MFMMRALATLFLLESSRGSAPAAEADFAAVKGWVRARFPKVAQLSTAELKAWQADASRQGPVLLDVRTKAEFAISHLPGAIHVDPSAKAAAVIPLLRGGAPVVAYCSVGYRSSALAQRLVKAGVPSVYNLEGSIFQWANEGGPLEADGKPASKVHPYNKTYGLLLNADKRAATQ